MASSSLEKLRKLTTNLCQRDENRVVELDLYHAFFSNIPLHTFVWTVDCAMNIVAKNRKSLCSSSNIISNGTIKDAFSCPQMNEYNIEMHVKAFTGETQTYLSYEDKSSFLTTLIPDCSGDVVSKVHGCSWDITSLQVMIDTAAEAECVLREHAPDLANRISNVYAESQMVQLIIKLRNKGVADG
jgi:hypothetical protein